MGVIDWPESGVARLKGRTRHARLDGPAHEFAYDVDYVLLRLAPDHEPLPAPFGWGRFSPASYWDADHGDGETPAVDWAKQIAADCGLAERHMREVWLLTQPRRFGYVFNPVSFWLFRDADGGLRAVLAEVNNTYGDRHSYFCAAEDFAPITRGTRISRPKAMHVSPFQDVAGSYEFRFDVGARRLAITVKHTNGAGGMTASLGGAITPLTRAAAARAALRPPVGAFRIIGLIHLQALKLYLKGAAFRERPLPPTKKVTG